ncbi:hypothetical protein T265_01735 [Opisthorchis viverrini]|uniref:Uncharacterized protein n=1 Tax=Opisthorchis viverrini TaxID=6198 RepID=A0A074ZXD5_OPIVI|nr:hypothetical protein T265_01735 [Opisthorchis viverrini]KER32113.1 hypothetical protein T265_01735 [Opisthorchis viverrini]
MWTCIGNGNSLDRDMRINGSYLCLNLWFYTGCAPVTKAEEVASQKDNLRSVCGSLGCAPTSVDSRDLSEDNGAHSHCGFLGCALKTTCEQTVPPTTGAGFYGEPVYPSVEVTHMGVIHFQTVSTQCLRFMKLLAWKKRLDAWRSGFSICVCYTT